MRHELLPETLPGPSQQGLLPGSRAWLLPHKLGVSRLCSTGWEGLRRCKVSCKKKKKKICGKVGDILHLYLQLENDKAY